jgi:hypothetical protein
MSLYQTGAKPQRSIVELRLKVEANGTKYDPLTDSFMRAERASFLPFKVMNTWDDTRQRVARAKLQNSEPFTSFCPER